MQFATDPPISDKIQKMAQRVRWHDPAILKQGIDQTRLVLDDQQDDRSEFSFLVMGDTGSGPEHGQHPQRRVAEAMLPHVESSQFIIHTGDVVYLVGSSEYYQANFIKPYKELLVGGERPRKIAFDHMVFKTPMFLVPGNHDYYDLSLVQGVLGGATLSLRRLRWLRIDFDIGWHGSYQGKAYAQAFLDCLNRFATPEQLTHHLEQHYTAKTETGYCLRYEPSQFTRLPNRYYTFRYGGIDFFALDSNTFNAPLPIPDTQEGDNYRQQLIVRRRELEEQKQTLFSESDRLNRDRPEDSDALSDLRAKLQQLDETILDIDKQLSSDHSPDIDVVQLEWLQQRLINSWHNKEVRGRVLFFHHPPYVTEATKWSQAQTITIRRNLRRVLNAVAGAVGSLASDRPLVDLVLSGHAHCMDYLQTVDTGHADSHMHWLVCGGSGFSLRRQREEGTELTEVYDTPAGRRDRVVARSHLFVGRSGHGSLKRRPYSFLKIDVQAGSPLRFVVTPFVTERFQRQWQNYALPSFTIQPGERV